jgi:MarR family transcriptional regulator, organic hydroperoxide resistance regulator
MAAAPASADPVLEFLRLMWSVDHELHRISKRMATQIGLTAPQRLALRFIGRHPRVTLGDLAELLHLHPGTVTGIVRHLEARGLVERERSSEDVRRVHLTLTAGGRRVDRRHTGTVEAAVRRALGGLNATEFARAAKVLQRLATELAAE